MCACRRSLCLGCLSAQILSLLLYLEHLEGCGYFRPLAGPLCVLRYGIPPEETLATVEFHSSPFSTHSYARLSSAPVVCLCLLFIFGPGLIPLADHRHSNSTHLSCHQFLCLFIFHGFYLVRVLRSLIVVAFFFFLDFTAFFSLPSPSTPRSVTYLVNLKTYF